MLDESEESTKLPTLKLSNLCRVPTSEQNEVISSSAFKAAEVLQQ